MKTKPPHSLRNTVRFLALLLPFFILMLLGMQLYNLSGQDTPVMRSLEARIQNCDIQDPSGVDSTFIGIRLAEARPDYIRFANPGIFFEEVVRLCGEKAMVWVMFKEGRVSTQEQPLYWIVALASLKDGRTIFSLADTEAWERGNERTGYLLLGGTLLAWVGCLLFLYITADKRSGG